LEFFRIVSLIGRSVVSGVQKLAGFFAQSPPRSRMEGEFPARLHEIAVG
jgi:hypothetical protein